MSGTNISSLGYISSTLTVLSALLLPLFSLFLTLIATQVILCLKPSNGFPFQSEFLIMTYENKHGMLPTYPQLHYLSDFISY